MWQLRLPCCQLRCYGGWRVCVCVCAYHNWGLVGLQGSCYGIGCWVTKINRYIFILYLMYKEYPMYVARLAVLGEGLWNLQFSILKIDFDSLSRRKFPIAKKLRLAVIPNYTGCWRKIESYSSHFKFAYGGFAFWFFSCSQILILKYQ